MKVGLLYEGDLDEKPLKIIIGRILQEIDPSLTDIEFIPKPAYGSIEGHIRISAILFFKTNSCDLAVFVADLDGDERKRSRIRSQVTRFCREIGFPSRSVVGFPSPEFEQWLLDEENAIRHVLPLPSDRPLPYAEMSSKERLNRIIDEHIDITATASEVYTEISELLNFGKLKMCSPSFKSFYSSFENTI